jgi:hypothetical protein
MGLKTNLAENSLSPRRPSAAGTGDGAFQHPGLLRCDASTAQQLLSVSPAVVFVLGRDKNGIAQELVQVNFPVHISARARNKSMAPRGSTDGSKHANGTRLIQAVRALNL